MLRCYGGLFSDYCFIDESWVAQQAGIDTNQTYMALIELNKKRIISFIPRRKVPLITYLRDREDCLLYTSDAADEAYDV